MSGWHGDTPLPWCQLDPSGIVHTAGARKDHRGGSCRRLPIEPSGTITTGDNSAASRPTHSQARVRAAARPRHPGTPDLDRVTGKVHTRVVAGAVPLARSRWSPQLNR